MSDVLAQIDDFRRFAAERLSSDDALSVRELFDEWEGDGPLSADEEADLRAVAEALQEYDAGGPTLSRGEFDRELRRRTGRS